jgi:hypothetical protein
MTSVRIGFYDTPNIGQSISVESDLDPVMVYNSHKVQSLEELIAYETVVEAVFFGPNARKNADKYCEVSK